MTLVWGSRRSCWAWWTGEGWCFHTLGFPLASSQPPFESHQRNTYRIQRKNKEAHFFLLYFNCFEALFKVYLRIFWTYKWSVFTQTADSAYSAISELNLSLDGGPERKPGRGGSGGRDDGDFLFISWVRTSFSCNTWPGISCSLLGSSFCKETRARPQYHSDHL